MNQRTVAAHMAFLIYMNAGMRGATEQERKLIREKVRPAVAGMKATTRDPKKYSEHMRQALFAIHEVRPNWVIDGEDKEWVDSLLGRK